MARIVRVKDDVVISKKAEIADSFLKRLSGLIPRKSLGIEEAMIFYNAPSIHMLFMRFSIDVVFLDKQGSIVHICHDLLPWRMASCMGSKITLELPAGTAHRFGLEVGQILGIRA